MFRIPCAPAALRPLVPCLLFAAVTLIASPATATNYWVSPGGSDTAAGTRARPWRTINHALGQLAPGDKLTIGDGVYVEQVKVYDLHGSAARRITISGESRNGAIIRGLAYDARTQRGLFPFDTRVRTANPFYGIHLADASHITIENLTVQGTVGTGIYGVDITEIEVRDVSTNYTGMGGIVLEDGKSATDNNIKVLACSIDRSNLVFLDTRGLPVHGAESITISRMPGFEVAYNTVRNSFKEGIGIKLPTSSGAVHHNTVEFTRSVGIYLNEGSRCSVHDNVVRDTFHFQLENSVILRSDVYFGSANPPVPNPYGYTFPRATLDKGASGILINTGDLSGNGTGRVHDNTVVGNQIYRIWKNGISVDDSWQQSPANPRGVPGFNDGHLIAHNTIVDVGVGPNWLGVSLLLHEVATNLAVHNNIAEGCEVGVVINAPRGTTATQFTTAGQNAVSHNLYWRFAAHPGALALADPTTIVADPRLTRATGATGSALDLQLAGHSPAIDMGQPLALPFLGAVPDLGCHEFDNRSNGRPVATDDRAAVEKAGSVILDVLANDTDPDGQPLTPTWVALGPSRGRAVITAGNQIHYTPNPWVTGRDQFDYAITDGHGGTAVARVTVLISHENVTHYGRGVAGTAGLEPSIDTNTPPYLGFAGFALELRDALPNADAVLIIGDQQAAVRLQGVTALVETSGALTTPAVTDANGDATFAVPIPWNPTSIGEVKFAQIMVADPGGPLGVAATDGLRFVLFVN